MTFFPKSTSYRLIMISAAVLLVVIALLLVNHYKNIRSVPESEAIMFVQALEQQFPDSAILEEIADPNIIVIVHNADSFMCKKALDFFDRLPYETQQYVTTGAELQELTEFKENCGLNFDLIRDEDAYPTIFVRDRVFIGFSVKIQKEIEALLN